MYIPRHVKDKLYQFFLCVTSMNFGEKLFLWNIYCRTTFLQIVIFPGRESKLQHIYRFSVKKDLCPVRAKFWTTFSWTNGRVWTQFQSYVASLFLDFTFISFLCTANVAYVTDNMNVVVPSPPDRPPSYSALPLPSCGQHLDTTWTPPEQFQAEVEQTALHHSTISHCEAG